MRDHVVIIGSGRVGRHLAETLGRVNVPRLVVEFDPAVLAKLQALQIPVLFGDAANSEILQHASLTHARALVITVPDGVSALAMVAAARKFAPGVTILARAASWDSARRLRDAGVQHIVRPELEGGVEIVRQTLAGLDFAPETARELADAVRREDLGLTSSPSQTN